MAGLQLADPVRKGLEKIVSEWLYVFTLARIGDMQEVMLEAPEDLPYPESTHDSFDNITSDEPVKKLKRPVTIMRSAKVILTAYLTAVADAIMETGKLPGAGVWTHLANLKAVHGREIGFMIDVVQAMKINITDCGRIGRDLDSVESFAARLQSLIVPKTYTSDIDGTREVARLFVMFLKCVAVLSANMAVEKKVTINGEHVLACIRILALMQNSIDDLIIEEMLEYLRDEVSEVIEASAAAKPRKSASDDTDPSEEDNATPSEEDEDASAAKPAAKPAAKTAAAKTAAAKAAAAKTAAAKTAAAKTAAKTPAAKTAAAKTAAAKTATAKTAAAKTAAAKTAAAKTGTAAKTAAAKTAAAKPAAGAKTAAAEPAAAGKPGKAEKPDYVAGVMDYDALMEDM